MPDVCVCVWILLLKNSSNSNNNNEKEYDNKSGYFAITKFKKQNKKKTVVNHSQAKAKPFDSSSELILHTPALLDHK